MGRPLPDADTVQVLRRMGDELQLALQRAASGTALQTIPEVADRIRLSEGAVRWNARHGQLRHGGIGTGGLRLAAHAPGDGRPARLDRDAMTQTDALYGFGFKRPRCAMRLKTS